MSLCQVKNYLAYPNVHVVSERFATMMYARWLALIGILFLVACHPLSVSQPDVIVAMITNPSPPVVGPSTITLFIHSAHGIPIHGAAVQVEGTPSHHREPSVWAQASELSPGVYYTTVRWPHAGSWFVLVYTTFGSGQTVIRQVELPYIHAP